MGCNLFFHTLRENGKTNIGWATKGLHQDEILPEKTVYRWHKAFWDGRKSLTSQPKRGRPTSQITKMNVNSISVMIWEDRHLSVRALEELINIFKSTIHRILMENLGMRYFFLNTFFYRVLSNMFHITCSSSEPIYTADFVLVSLGRYWIILLAHFGFILIGCTTCQWEDFSHYFWDNLCN